MLNEKKNTEGEVEETKLPAGVLETIRALEEKVKALEEGNITKPPVRVEDGQRLAYITLYKDKIIKGFNGRAINREIETETGKKITPFIDLLMIDFLDKEKERDDKSPKDFNEKIVKNVNLFEMLKDSDQVKVKLLEKMKIDETYSEGLYDAENPDPHHDKSFMSDTIDLIVKKNSFKFKIEVIDDRFKELKGKTFVLHQVALNL